MIKPPLKIAVVILRDCAKISKQTLDVCVCVCVCVQNQASERFKQFIFFHFFTHTFPFFGLIIFLLHHPFLHVKKKLMPL